MSKNGRASEVSGYSGRGMGGILAKSRRAKRRKEINVAISDSQNGGSTAPNQSRLGVILSASSGA